MHKVLLKFIHKLELVDHERNSWYLFSEGKGFILSSVCDFSFVGYDFIMALNDLEIAKYEELGASYLRELSSQINCSSPISKKSTSKFKDRALSESYSKKFLNAINRWEKKNNARA